MATQIELMRSDILAHAKSLTELTTILRDVKTKLEEIILESAVREATEMKDEQALERRLKKIEDEIKEQKTHFDEKFKKLYNLAWWLLATFGAVFVVAVANFIIKGGLTVTTITTGSS